MAETSDGATPEAIARAHAVYTPLSLHFYDVVVHGLSNRFAWRCPTQSLTELYTENVSPNHLEAGVGTGLFLERARPKPMQRLTLLDINRDCLRHASRRLAHLEPEMWEASLLAPLPANRPRYDSVALTYVLHCLPGTMNAKLAAVDSLKRLLSPGGVFFGATILGRGIQPNPAARSLLVLYNRKGVFNNDGDDRAGLERGLRARFDHVDIRQEGCVALFRAA